MPGSFGLLEASSFMVVHGLFLELKPRNSLSICGERNQITTKLFFFQVAERIKL